MILPQKSVTVRRHFRKRKTWAGNVFTPGPQLDTVLSAIRAAAERKLESVTIKILKRTWTIDKDANGMIRIRMTYKDTNEETF